MDEKKRLVFVDVAKAIAIFLVVLGHVVSSNTTTKLVLYSFHMPLFFILSGFFFSMNGGGVEQTRKKFMSLIVPFLLWGAIYCDFSLKNLALVFYGTRETLCYAHSLSSLWFLPALFVGFVLNYVFSFVQSKIPLNKLLTDVSGVILFLAVGFLIPHNQKYGLPWSADVAFVSAGFIRVGLLTKDLFCALGKMRFYKVLICMIPVVGVFCFTCCYCTSPVGYVLMANALYGNPFVFVGNALLGSLAVILVSLLIERVPWHKWNPYIVGQHTLGIFLVHKPFAELGRKVFDHFHLDYNYLPFSIFLSLIVLLVSVVLVLIINKIIPSVFGRVNKA